MLDIRWLLGDTVAFVGKHVTLLCQASIPTSVSQLWDVVQSATEIAPVVDFLNQLEGGQPEVFAILSHAEGHVTVAMRGDAALQVDYDAGSSTIAGTEELTYHDFDNPVRVALTLTGAQRVESMVSLPVVEGVVPAAHLSFYFAASEAGVEGDAESEVVPVPVEAEVESEGESEEADVEDGQGDYEEEYDESDEDFEAAAEDGEEDLEEVAEEGSDEEYFEAESEDESDGEYEDEVSEESVEEGEDFEDAEAEEPAEESDEDEDDEEEIPAGVYGRIRMSNGDELDITETVVFGRMPALPRESDRHDPQLVIVESPRALVSRSHCMLRVDDGVVSLVDMHSNNGTFLHGEDDSMTRANPGERVPLHVGSVVDLGDGVSFEVTELY